VTRAPCFEHVRQKVDSFFQNALQIFNRITRQLIELVRTLFELMLRPDAKAGREGRKGLCMALFAFD
jgi:hypothetical protein